MSYWTVTVSAVTVLDAADLGFGDVHGCSRSFCCFLLCFCCVVCLTFWFLTHLWHRTWLSDELLLLFIRENERMKHLKETLSIHHFHLWCLHETEIQIKKGQKIKKILFHFRRTLTNFISAVWFPLTTVKSSKLWKVLKM